MNLGPKSLPLDSWPEVNNFTFQTLTEFNEQSLKGCVWNDDGSRLYVCYDDASVSAIITADPAWSVAYVPEDETSPDHILTRGSNRIREMAFNSDGTACFVAFLTLDTIEEIANAGTAYNPASGDLTVTTDSFDVDPDNPRSIDCKPDGTQIWYVTGNTGRAIYEVNLSVADDLTSAAMGNSYDPPEGDILGMKFAPDGKKFYTMGLDRLLREYTVSTDWDITSASYSGRSLDLTGPEHDGNKADSFDISPDGTKMAVTFGDATTSENEIAYYTS